MENPIVEVPEEVIFTHVLPKLPVKSILRFKSVCKSWNLTISSPEFAKSHLRYSSSNTRQYLIRNRLEEWYSISCDGSTLKPAVLLDYRNIYPDYVVNGVVCCCNGLVCLLLGRFNSNNWRSYALWNPATHELRIIPFPEQAYRAYYFGFGYVPGLDDYIIFTASRKPYVFSVRSGNWSEVKDKLPVEIPYVGYTEIGVCVGDTMCWYFRGSSSRKFIIGFNFVTHKFETIPISPKVLLEYNDDPELYVIQGCLSLCYRCWRPAKIQYYEVWMMTQLGVSDSWKKSFGLTLSGRVDSVNFSIFGKCCVLDLDYDKLKLLDYCTGGFEEIQIHKLPYQSPYESTYYFPSLIAPFGTLTRQQRLDNSRALVLAKCRARLNELSVYMPMFSVQDEYSRKLLYEELEQVRVNWLQKQ